MLEFPLINKVVENDFCIACGACVEVCPQKVVIPFYNDYRGAHEVKIEDSTHCSECSAPCDSVCPSIEVDFQKISNNNHFPQDRVGPIESTFLAYSSEYQFNGKSSSGGTIRAFIADALKKETPVICLTKEGNEYKPSTLYKIEDLDNVPGSIYHSVSYTDCIKHLKMLEKPCFLVATSCQLEGVLNYINFEEPSLRGKISLIIGLICGWMYSDHAVQSFARYKGIQSPVHDAQYRGEDKVGLLKIWTDREKHSFDRRKFSTIKESLDYKASFSSSMNRLRCRVCENHVNVLSDISVGDAWLERKQSEKMSIVIARTTKGKEAVLRLKDQGDLLIEQSDVSDILESQSENLVEGYSARKMSKFLTERDIKTPNFNFGESSTSTLKVSFRELMKINQELFFRALIRDTSYKKYRFLYFVSHIPRFFKEAIQKYWRATL